MLQRRQAVVFGLKQLLQITEQSEISKTTDTLLNLNSKVLGKHDWVNIREQQDILKANHPCEPILEHLSSEGMKLD